jgi:hypothetical protein
MTLGSNEIYEPSLLRTAYGTLFFFYPKVSCDASCSCYFSSGLNGCMFSYDYLDYYCYGLMGYALFTLGLSIF